jgi:hypothetical protein
MYLARVFGASRSSANRIGNDAGQLAESDPIS